MLVDSIFLTAPVILTDDLRIDYLTEDVHLLEIHSPDGSIVRKLMNFREIHRKIIDALGPFVQKSYFAPS
jgi:hypothetical protein